MLEQLLTLVYQLPLGLLLAAVFVEFFVLFKDRRDAEPAILWLLFCAAGAGLLCGGLHFLTRGTADYFIFVGLASATAAVAFWFKRQARNLGVASLKDRFYPPGSYAPVQMPNQTTFILGYRGALFGAVALTLVGLYVGKVLVPAGGATEGTGVPNTVAGAPAPATPTAPTDPAAPAPTDPAAPAVAVNPPADPAAPATPAAPAAPTDPAAPATPGEVAAPADPAMVPAPGTPPATPPTDPAAPKPDGTPATPPAPAAPTDPAAPAAPGTPAAPAAPSTPVMSQAAVLADMRPISKNSIFGSKIRPLIQKHCITCHGAEKQKGDLRLDTPDFIRAGVRGKGVIVAGKPDNSSLLASITKPLGDEDRMPPKGDGIGASDAAMIKKWIAAGADFGDGVSSSGADEIAFAEDKLAATLQPPPAALIDELKKEGVLVRPVSKDGRVLDLDLSHTDYSAGEIKLDRLKPIFPNIHSMDLSRTRIDDNDLANLAGMVNLTRLFLSRTEVSDAGVAHLKGLKELQYLNIYGTKVTDGGLKNLEGLSKLQKIYTWQSMVTPAGASSLQSKIPGLAVNTGGTPVTTPAPPK